MRRYRESVLAGLVEDGYTIIDADDADDDESGAVIESVKAASVELYTAECQAIAQADELSDAVFSKSAKLNNSMRIIGEIRTSCKFKKISVNNELTVGSSAR
jgi:hypothetical protein